MKVTFVRTVGKPDRFYVVRADGTEASSSFPSYGDALPHDLVHLVVEAGFELRNGIWGRVARGVDLEAVNAQANRKGGKVAEKYAGLGEDLAEVFVSEALANASWWERTLSAAQRVEDIRASCARFAVAMPVTVTPERSTRVQEVLERLGRRWRTLVPKGAIALELDPADPLKSFLALER
jgi:hypothetical protein